MRAHFAIFSVAAFLALVDDASPARILGLFPHAGRSHHMVFEPLLRRLAEKGHQVTSVSFFPLKNPPANYTDVSLEGVADLGVETVDFKWFEYGNSYSKLFRLHRMEKQINDIAPLENMAVSMCSRLVSWAPLAEALKKDYDVVLLENFNSDCMFGMMHVYGKKLPTIGLVSSGLMQWTADRIGLNDNPAYVPSMSSDSTPTMTFMERLQNTIVISYLKLWYRYKIQMKEQEVIERHFDTKIPDLRELAKNTTMILSNVFHSLNGVKPMVPAFVEVGGMHLQPKESTDTTIPPYIERFLKESEHGVVVCSFGSLIKTSTLPEYKEQMIMNSFSKLKQNVIWKYEDSAEEGTRIGNVLKVRWLPQYELLKHKKVVAFIGHGGLLGMTEVITVGKPMLSIPLFGDQYYNGAMSQKSGLGPSIPYEHLTEASFYEAVKAILSDEMRQSALRVSQMWHDREMKPLDKAVYSVERVIRWGHHDPLHSAARDLSIFQTSLLDVAAFLVLTIIALILVAKCLICLVVRTIKARFSSKGKDKLH